MELKSWISIEFFITFLQRTALHLAVLKGDLDIINLLIQNPSIDFNAKDEILLIIS